MKTPKSQPYDITDYFYKRKKGRIKYREMELFCVRKSDMCYIKGNKWTRKEERAIETESIFSLCDFGGK